MVGLQILEQAVSSAMSQQQIEAFKSLMKPVMDAIAAGWMCTQGGDGLRFGRLVEPSHDTRDLSVDVVDLSAIKGPHQPTVTDGRALVLYLLPKGKIEFTG